MTRLNHERRNMTKRNRDLTTEVERLRPLVKDLEWQLSVQKTALASICKNNKHQREVVLEACQRIRQVTKDEHVLRNVAVIEHMVDNREET